MNKINHGTAEGFGRLYHVFWKLDIVSRALDEKNHGTVGVFCALYHGFGEKEKIFGKAVDGWWGLWYYFIVS